MSIVDRSVRKVKGSVDNIVNYLPKSIWILNVGMMINVIAGSFLWPLNVIFMTRELNQTLITAGVVMMIMAAVSAIGNMLGGLLFDHFGGFRTSFAGILITFIALIGLNVNAGWPFYPIFISLIGLGQGIVFPAMFAMIGTTWPEGGRKSYNVCYLLQNLGVAIGTGIGGFVAGISYHLAFTGFLVFYIFFILIAWFGIRNIKPASASQKLLTEEYGRSSTRALGALFIISLAYFLCWLGYVQWQGVVPDYVTRHGMTLQQYGLFWTINGALIVCLQPILGRLMDFWRISLKTQILIGIIIFIGSFWMTASAKGFLTFLLAMSVLTIGEIFIWPAVPNIANMIAPPGKAGLFQGIASTAATCGRMVGPLFGSTLVLTYSFHALFIVLMAFMLIAIAATYLHDRFLHVTIISEQKIKQGVIE